MSMIRKTLTVAVGQPVYLNLQQRGWDTPMGLCIRPGAGGTIDLETSMCKFEFDSTTKTPITPNDDGTAFNDTVKTAEDSPYSDVTEIFRAGQCTYMRFTALGATGYVDIMA